MKPRPEPAHPRSRGENVRLDRVEEHLSGSSPLTRGKPRQSSSPAAPTRLIPAHAGKTWAVGPSLRYQKAHPRSRGENGKILRPKAVQVGSSPLTRGKQDSSD